MQQLRSAMDSAISNTAEQAAARGQDLVQRLTGYSSGYYGGVARNTGSMGTGGSGGPRFEPSARGGPQTSPGLYGATGEASSGPGGFAGDPSLHGLASEKWRVPMSDEELDDTATTVYEGICGRSGPPSANQRSNAARDRR